MRRQHGRWSVPLARNRDSFQQKVLFEALSILIFAASVFIVCALFTYDSRDPSFLSNAKVVAYNACGWVGAYLSAFLLQGLGLGGYLVPAALAFIGVTIYQREGMARCMGILGGMAVAVMALAVFVSLQWKAVHYNGTELLTGGTFGAWVAQKLIHPLNPLGASITSIVVFCMALVLSTPLSIVSFLAKAGRVVFTAIFRFARLLGTYFIYLLGISAVRLGQGANDVSHRFLVATRSRMKQHSHLLKDLLFKPLEKMRRREAVSITSSAPGMLIQSTHPERMEPIRTNHVDGSEVKFEEDLDSEEFEDEDLEEYDEVEEDDEADDEAGPDILPFERPQSDQKVSSKRNQRSIRKGGWKLPSIDFLEHPPEVDAHVDRQKLVENSQILKQKLADFGINGDVVAVRPGPVITLYEFKPGAGVKVSKIAALADDLSMALSAESVRILAPLPGKAVVGIEIPSDHREMVFLKEFFQQGDFHSEKRHLPVVMGKDISGHPVIADLSKMPHLLCAGQTGSGKSVFMNGLICSLLYRFTPDEMRMILVDPKFIEFRAYQEIPHLLLPVVDDPKNASTALKWAVREMERRYRILANIGARNLASYNKKVEEMGEDVVHDLLLSEESQSLAQSGMSGADWIESFDRDEKGNPRIGKLPFIVIIIDELADLMMIAKKDVELSVARIAQKARAAGIHLVIATQRPSTDVITGLIKANLPSRASFRVASHIDSKTILDRPGAERLLGQGDMLFIPPGSAQPQRVHAAYVNDDEIEKVSRYLRSQGRPIYREEILSEEEGDEWDDEESDDLFQDAVVLVRQTRQASASYLQRHLKIGYNRAARMIETMESRGIVGPADGARPREVLIQ